MEPKVGKTKIILAGNYQQFTEYCQQHDLSTSDCIFPPTVNGVRRLMGICGHRETELIRVGTWYQRDDIAEIEAYINSHSHSTAIPQTAQPEKIRSKFNWLKLLIAKTILLLFYLVAGIAIIGMWCAIYKSFMDMTLGAKLRDLVFMFVVCIGIIGCFFAWITLFVWAQDYMKRSSKK
jgi:hypothetical protein